MQYVLLCLSNPKTAGSRKSKASLPRRYENEFFLSFCALGLQKDFLFCALLHEKAWLFII